MKFRSPPPFPPPNWGIMLIKTVRSTEVRSIQLYLRNFWMIGSGALGFPGVGSESKVKVLPSVCSFVFGLATSDERTQCIDERGEVAGQAPLPTRNGSTATSVSLRPSSFWLKGSCPAAKVTSNGPCIASSKRAADIMSARGKVSLPSKRTMSSYHGPGSFVW